MEFFSPFVDLPATVSGTLTYTLPTEAVFPADVIAQAITRFAAERGVARTDIPPEHSVIMWEFQSHPCPNPPVSRDTNILMLRVGAPNMRRMPERGCGVVFVRKDAENYISPSTIRYTYHLPLPQDNATLFHASQWVDNLTTGNGDFLKVLKQYIEERVNRPEYWSVLERDEAHSGRADVPVSSDMADDPDVTTVVELAAQGEWDPEVLQLLAPYKHHEVSFRSGNFQVHRLGFVAYDAHHERLLLRAVVSRDILGYDSLDVTAGKFFQ